MSQIYPLLTEAEELVVHNLFLTFEMSPDVGYH